MDIRDVDLNLLVALEALLAERNVTRAAHRLGLSQSSMSASLGRLRVLFNDPLLLRTARGMLPTTKASELAAPVKQILDEIGRIVRQAEAFDPARATTTFTITASDYVEFAILPRLVDHLEARAPGCRLAVRPISFATLGEQLERGDVDLAILGTSNAPENARVRPLYPERFVGVVRRDHPRVSRQVTLDEFCALEHVLISPSGGAFVAQTDAALAALGRSRTVRLSVPHFLLVPEILARSDLMAVIPERLARVYAQRLRILELPFELEPLIIAEVWHERTHRDPAHVWLRQLLVDLMAKDAVPLPRVPQPPRRSRKLDRRATQAV
ncbi:MAG: LysR family transcriptional regulator [Burkholderiales bacterium]|nr:LysR family transcriptional regulator [Burkholderiales bacterium]